MLSRPSTPPIMPVLSALALLSLLLGTYVGGYVFLGERKDYIWSDWPDGSPDVQTCIVRRYPHKWLKAIYLPAGEVETRLGGTNVMIKYISD